MMTNETKWRRVAMATGIVAVLAVIAAAYERDPVETPSAEPSTAASPARASAPRAPRSAITRIVESVRSVVAFEATERKIPAGTTVAARIVSPISSRDAQEGDAVTAVTTQDLRDGQEMVVPSGTTVIGRVIEVRSAAETRSKAVLRVAFHRIGSHESNLSLERPDLVARAQNANRAADAALVVGGVVVGAVIGDQVSDRNGREIGAVAGGIGGGVAAANLGANVQLLANEAAVLRFSQDLYVR